MGSRYPLEEIRLFVRQEREKQGLTQKDLAERSGISTGTISNFERNDRVVGFDMVEYMLEGLGYELAVRRREKPIGRGAKK